MRTSGIPIRIIKLMVLLSLALVLCSASVPAQQSEDIKRVVILYWYDKDYPGHVMWDQSFQGAIKASAQPFEIYPEYLEANRFPGETQQQVVHEYLRQKYAARPPDVVVAQSEVSLSFILNHRNDLFTNVPIVFYSGTRPDLGGHSDVTGVLV